LEFLFGSEESVEGDWSALAAALVGFNTIRSLKSLSPVFLD